MCGSRPKMPTPLPPPAPPAPLPQETVQLAMGDIEGSVKKRKAVGKRQLTIPPVGTGVNL